MGHLGNAERVLGTDPFNITIGDAVARGYDESKILEGREYEVQFAQF
jgi:hypothetical protein